MTGDSPPRPPWWALLPILLAGVFLRAWNFDSPVLFMDEIHAIQYACESGYRHILTTYEVADSCIPLTAWDRLLVESGRLSEFGIRLPSVIGGCLLLLAIVLLARKALRPAEGVLLAGVTATSPYLVYLSREARPYPIVYALFAISFLLASSWQRGGGGWRFIVAAILAALAMWFHPIVFPALTVLALQPLPGVIRQRDRRRAVTYAAGGAIFAGLVLLLLLPALGGLREQRGIKSGLGTAGVETALHSVDYLLGFAIVDAPWWIWAGVAAIGVTMLAIRFPWATAMLGLMTAAQILLIRQTQPWLAEIPWVGFRYVAHLMPFFLAALIVPLGSVLEAAGRLGKRVFVPVAGLVLVAGYASAHVVLGHYVLSDDGAYNMHPQVMFMSPEENARILDEPIADNPNPTDVSESTAFYRRLRDGELPPGGVIHAPMIFTFPTFEYYRRIHRRPIKTGAVRLDGARWQRLFSPPHEGLALRTVADVQNLDIAKHPGFRYVVFHKRLFWEMVLLDAKGETQPVLGRHTIPYRVMMDLLWEVELGGAKEISSPPTLARRGKLVHEDYWIDVWDMRPGE